MWWYAYIGAGAFLHGVPTRDLTQDEWDALPADVQEAALRLGIYAPATEADEQEEEAH